MKDEQTRGDILQWLVPIIVLIVIVIVMLFNFSSKSSQSAAEEVEDRLINTVEEYATKVKHELVRMSDAGRPIGSMIEEHVQPDNKLVAEMADTLFLTTEAYAVAYYKEGKDAILHDGSTYDIAGTQYFESLIKAAADDEESTEKMKVHYIYTADDELGTSKEAFIAAINLDNKRDKDMLLMYYPVERIKELFKKTEWDGDCFYTLIDPDGRIIETEGSQSSFTAMDNLWNSIKQDSGYDADKIVRATVRMKNLTPGSLKTSIGKESRTLVYAPVGINKWTLVMGINQNYVDNLQSKEWRNTKHMIYQLVAAILIFIGLVAFINIINRIKSSEKSKELEEKADTDQLTSLCNKLATERKIKEYIANNPNEQALMFVLDIDNFKKVNDTLGHAFGDEVLRSLGHQIGAIFRATDVIGRTGGDEFTILLKSLNDDFLLEKEAKKLCDFFKNFQAGEYVKYAATASIGAAVFPRDGKDFESLYKAADSALYIAKKRGKSQLAFYGNDNDKSESKKKVEEESRKGK